MYWEGVEGQRLRVFALWAREGMGTKNPWIGRYLSNWRWAG